MNNRIALVLGSSGFIGNHLVKDLKQKGFFVIGVDKVQTPSYGLSPDEFLLGDLTEEKTYEQIKDAPIERVYQMAANMGGAEYIFTGKNDLAILRDNLQIQIFFSKWVQKAKPKKVFFASSACIYPVGIQNENNTYECAEDQAFPADPDSVYGWEKLTAEILYETLSKNSASKIYIGRLHNVYGPNCPWKGGKEKAPAAICRKVAKATEGEDIVIFGSGHQKRTFLYIEDCLKAIELLLQSNCHSPLNIGSNNVISIQELTQMVIDLSEKKLNIRPTEQGPVGVLARSSNNNNIIKELGWKPRIELEEGMKLLYSWILNQLRND